MTRRAPALNGRSFPWTGLDPERRNTLLLYGAVGLVLLIAVALIGYGYYDDRIAPKNATVLSVGRRDFDLGDLERRAKSEARRGVTTQTDVSQFILGALGLMEREELLRQTDARLKVSPTDDELDAAMRTRLSMPAEATRPQVASRLRGELLRLGFSFDEYRALARADAIEAKLRTGFREALPAEADQVDLVMIQVGSQSQALEIRDSLAGGQTFTILAATRSLHSSRRSAGELGWVPRGGVAKPLEDAAFALEPGGVSEIIETDDGFYLLQSRGKAVRPVDEKARGLVAEQQLTQALRETRTTVGSSTKITESQVRRIAVAVAAAANVSQVGG